MAAAGVRVGSQLDAKLVNAAIESPAISPAASLRTVLLIAFHFPPMKGSSGLQRTLRFAQHLPAFGWRPIVLTVNPEAHDAIAEMKGNEIPPDLIVHRAFCLNAAKQLSIFGRYPKFAALPDRWASWRLWAVRKAMRIIRDERVDALWSTFPLATTHGIGMEVAKRSGLPWVAEFRDPMWQHDWPTEAVANRVWRKLEQEIVFSADRLVFVAPNAIEMYKERFPTLPQSKLEFIENGYDEDVFKRAEADLPAAPLVHGGPVTLLHSGIIYRSERDPTQFFAAIAALKQRGAIAAANLRILLRATGDDADFQKDLDKLGIADIVKIEPSIDYMKALREMMTVDGLIILQAANCNAQIPAKLYEYLRAGRPILALTDPRGDTAATLNRMGTGLMARLDSQAEIEEALPRFIEQIRSATWRRASSAIVTSYSRRTQTGRLASLLDSLLPQDSNEKSVTESRAI
jgi:glycosyltransferase involved in cell wall biosynthesis